MHSTATSTSSRISKAPSTNGWTTAVNSSASRSAVLCPQACSRAQSGLSATSSTTTAKPTLLCSRSPAVPKLLATRAPAHLSRRHSVCQAGPPGPPHGLSASAIQLALQDTEALEAADSVSTTSKPPHNGDTTVTNGDTTTSSAGPSIGSNGSINFTGNRSPTNFIPSGVSFAEEDYLLPGQGVSISDSEDDDADADWVRWQSRDRGPRGALWPRGSVAAVILGGGEADSKRLFPLTMDRTLPAIPFGGSYRLIDIVMTNCINSGLNKIHVLTAFQSNSLNRHLTQTYNLAAGVPYGGDGYVEVVANSLGKDRQEWSTGSADAVRQFMSIFDSSSQNRFIDDVIILPSDQLYRADLSAAVQYHRDLNADVTVVCRPCTAQQATQMGIVKVDGGLRVRAFSEKPQGANLECMRMEPEYMERFVDGQGSYSEECEYLGSTGIYVFRRTLLSQMLEANPKSRDFARNLLPDMVRTGYKVLVHHMPGYWEDVGNNLADFHAANLRLLQPDPELELMTPDRQPMYRYPSLLPPTQATGMRLKKALISGGCILRDSSIENSIVGFCTLVGPNCTIQDSILHGYTHYEGERHAQHALGPDFPPLGVGSGTEIRKAIVDFNARIGSNCKLVNREGVMESNKWEDMGIYIKDGILVVAKGSVIPDGTVM